MLFIPNTVMLTTIITYCIANAVVFIPNMVMLTTITYYIVNAVVTYAITTSKESAGGPVFKEDNNKPRLIAVHNGSFAKVNYGVRLTEILKHWSKGQSTSNKAVSPSQELHPS